MNAMCLSCPRYKPGTVPARGESWYTMDRCPGTDNESYTGCIKKPWHPLASVLDLVYDLQTNTWKKKGE